MDNTRPPFDIVSSVPFSMLLWRWSTCVLDSYLFRGLKVVRGELLEAEHTQGLTWNGLRSKHRVRDVSQGMGDKQKAYVKSPASYQTSLEKTVRQNQHLRQLRGKHATTTNMEKNSGAYNFYVLVCVPKIHLLQCTIRNTMK